MGFSRFSSVLATTYTLLLIAAKDELLGQRQVKSPPNAQILFIYSFIYLFIYLCIYLFIKSFVLFLQGWVVASNLFNVLFWRVCQERAV